MQSKLSRLRWTALIGLALALVFLDGPTAFHRWIGAADAVPPFFHGLSDKIGESLLIAVFLAITVDLYVKRRLAEQVILEISPYLMSHSLPSSLRDEVAETCRMTVFRQKFELEYEFLEAGPDHVQNLTDVPQDYVHGASVQVTRDQHGANLVAIRSVGATHVLDVAGKPLAYDYPVKGEVLGTTVNAGFLREWTKSVRIPPTRQLSEERLPTFWSETAQVFTRENSDTFFFRHATVDVTISYRAFPGLIVTIDLGHRLHDKAAPHPRSKPTKWELHAAYFQNSAIFVCWGPTTGSSGQPKASILQSNDVSG